MIALKQGRYSSISDLLDYRFDLIMRTQDKKQRLAALLTQFEIWLRGLDSNQRPSGYTLPTIFIVVWTISLP